MVRRVLAFLPACVVPATALALLATLVAGHGRIPYLSPSTSNWDHVKYLAMAEQSFGDSPLIHDPPFAWRVLVTLLAHSLPVPTVEAFEILTLVGLLGAALGLAWALRGLALATHPSFWEPSHLSCSARRRASPCETTSSSTR